MKYYMLHISFHGLRDDVQVGWERSGRLCGGVERGHDVHNIHDIFTL